MRKGSSNTTDNYNLPHPQTEPTTSFMCSLDFVNRLWTGDADLRLYITTVQDG